MKIPESLMKLPRLYPIPVSQQHQAIRLMLELNALAVYNACLWANKRLGAKIKISSDRNARQGTKKIGDWFHEILRCCERIATLKNLSGIQTDSPVDRFEDIVNEFYIQGLTQCWASLYLFEETEYTSYVGKGKLTAMYNFVVSSVRKGSENLPQDSAFETTPEFAGFIADGILLGESNAAFKKEYWLPFLKAWREAIKEIDAKWCMTYFTQEQAVMQVGKGRHTRNLMPLYVDQPSRNDFLKPMQDKGYKS